MDQKSLMRSAITAHSVKGMGSGETDDIIGEMLANSQAEKKGGTLYRVIALTQAQHDLLQAGGHVDMEPRPFESWSRCKEGLIELLRLRIMKIGPCVILTRDVPDEEVALDMEAEAFACGLTEKDPGAQYFFKEKEVILHGSTPRLTVDMCEEVHWFGSPYMLPQAGESVLDKDGNLAKVIRSWEDEHYGPWVETEGDTFRVDYECGLFMHINDTAPQPGYEP